MNIEEHIKKICILCGDTKICHHEKTQPTYKYSYNCEHNKRKRLCIDCKGSGTCIHFKRFDNCKICNLNNYLIQLQRDCVRRIFSKSTKIVKESKNDCGCNEHHDCGCGGHHKH